MYKKILLSAGAALTTITIGAVPVLAAPTIPDNLPIFGPQVVQENPTITITDEQGNPVTGPVHRGDVLLVHGKGFASQANKGGFPLPVPAGQPNGVYVLYSAFPDQWQPSTGAPSATRNHPHNRMSWVITDQALHSVPAAPLNMQRTIDRVADRMEDDGSFIARITVDPPEQTPGNNWGVYVYPAAGSINAAEEIYIPLAYSPEPGANTPAPPTKDLEVDAGLWNQLAQRAGGSLGTTQGAALDNGTVLSFSRQADAGDGILRYRGVATSTARFALAATSLQNPWLEPRADGSWALSAEISRSIGEGSDNVQRVELGRVHGTSGTQQVFVGPLPIGSIQLNG